ncbi:MAG: 4Fe-4S dicluster domain-containing protein [Acidobacteria bacterium]|nr:MAG: 4Fe-4S dicluster domain-containing protein [Acidobacteriota bacterium]
MSDNKSTANVSTRKARYGMAVDLDRCNGCGACMLACSVENNIPPLPEEADDRKGITWIRVYKASNGDAFPKARTVFVPVLCQQCGHHTPCVSVCPQQAVDVDPATGIVGQVPERCLGCRYCMAACPYHARYFNWWDPVWPKGLEKVLNPAVAPRMRGVVEKCNLCHGRLHAARAKAAADGRREIQADEYRPACVEACPTRALTFGDLNDPASAVAQAAAGQTSFRLLQALGTDSKIYYISKRRWVRDLAERQVSRRKEEAVG